MRMRWIEVSEAKTEDAVTRPAVDVYCRVSEDEWMLKMPGMSMIYCCSLTDHPAAKDASERKGSPGPAHAYLSGSNTFLGSHATGTILKHAKSPLRTRSTRTCFKSRRVELPKRGEPFAESRKSQRPLLATVGHLESWTVDVCLMPGHSWRERYVYSARYASMP